MAEETQRLYCWNVNGIRAQHKKGFADWLKSERPDILCLQETKASEHQVPPDLLSLEGYHSYYHSGSKPGYCGVALITRERPLKLDFGIGQEIYDHEGRTIVAEYPNFVLINTYFPNGGASTDRLQYKLDFYEAYLEFIRGIAHKPVVMCGDFNTAHKEIDIARPKDNVNNSGFMPVERAWLDRLVEQGYLDTFRLFESGGGFYTWWDQRFNARSRNVGWRIDYFFVSPQLRANVKSAKILGDVMGSDHCPIVLELAV